tara:strand:- start:98 stop:526 length:429 start_codon:yes stop_codon:yes gene_type:complete
MKGKIMENNLQWFLENCTKQCSREMLYKDPLNLGSGRKYHESTTVEIKHYDPEVDTIPEKFLDPPPRTSPYYNLPFIKRSENPEFIYSDHIDKVEIYVTRHFGTMTSKGKLCWIRLKVNHTVYGEGGYRSTDYYELTLNEVK